MKTRIVAVAAFCVTLLAVPVFAATPSGGSLDSTKETVSWTGAPAVSNRVACTSSLDPTCDHYTLTINAPSIKKVFVGISPAEGFEADDYDLFVYDDKGVLVAADASPDGFESLAFEHNGSSFYEVRVQPWQVASGSSYRGVATRTTEQPFDNPPQDCDEFVPENVNVPVLDSGQKIELSVHLLLDGTDEARAREIMARAAESYRPLGIELALKRLETIAVSTTISDEIIQAAKDHVGGSTPKNIDLVGVFTNKVMQSIGGGLRVVGQADCIGGIRWDNRSFFVVSDTKATETPSGTSASGIVYSTTGLNMNVDATAETMAHEIGHLMGAHHHYANCVEGNLHSGAQNDLSPCTLMFNAVNGASLNFSTLSGNVVRGHAVNHAQP